MSVTRLRKRVVRMVTLPGGRSLVIEVRPDGVVVRRVGDRRCQLIPWSQLERMAIVPRSSRKEAFFEPAPEGWIPAPGSAVWLSGRGGTRVARGKVTRVVSTLEGEQHVMVHQADGVTQAWPVSELRPAPQKGD